MKREIVSVVILAYNNYNYYKECLDSILKQTYSLIEIIISDDASSNFEQNTIEKYINSKKKDNIVNVLIRKNERNSGIVKNYEKALSLAQGEYIFYLSIDDMFYDEKVLEDVVKYFRKTSYEIFTGYRETFFEDGTKRIEPYPHQVKVLKNDSLDKIFKRNIRNPMIAGACTPFRKSMIEKYGFVEKGYIHLEDWPRYVGLMERGIRIGFFDRKLIKYRAGGITTNFTNEDLIKDFGKFMSKYRYEPYSNVFSNIHKRKYLAGWGCSGGFTKCYDGLEKILDKRIDFLVDKNAEVWGSKVFDITIFPIEKILKYQKEDIFILIFSSVFYSEIADELEKMGFEEGEDFELISEPMVKGLGYFL